jgi:hypothetical protein
MNYFSRSLFVVSTLLLAASSAHAASDYILITEVQYDTFGSETGEWVELFNPTDSSISLEDWTLEEESGSIFTFPSFTLPSGEYLLLAKSESVFDANYSPGDFSSAENSLETGTKLLGNKLNNAGDALILKDSNGDSVDNIAWEQANWTHEASSGQTLARKTSIDTDVSADWEIVGATGSESGTPASGDYAVVQTKTSPSTSAVLPAKNTQSSARRYKTVYVFGELQVTLSCGDISCSSGIIAITNNKEKFERFAFSKQNSTST